MNFRTESFDFPQNEQRRCLSCDMTAHSTGDAVAQAAVSRTETAWCRSRPARRVGEELSRGPRPGKRRPSPWKVFTASSIPLLPISHSLSLRYRLQRTHLYDLAALGDHMVDEAVLLGLLRGEVPVA